MKAGDKFSHHFTVNAAHHAALKDVFMDRNPLHVDSAFAASKGFREPVMHGAILVGFLSWFVGEGLPDKEVIVHSYTIQFAKPVYLNDELELQATITDHFESVNTFEIKYNFLNTSGQSVARGKVTIGKLTT